MELMGESQSRTLREYFDEGYNFVIDSFIEKNREIFILYNLNENKIVTTEAKLDQKVSEIFSHSKKKKRVFDELLQVKDNQREYFKHTYRGNLLHGTDDFYLKIHECKILNCVPSVERKLYPLEDYLKEKNLRSAGNLAKSFASYSSHTQQISYMMLIEKLYGINITDKAKTIRMVVLELSRIIDHLRYLINLSRQIGHNQLFSECSDIYLSTKNLLQQLVPNRSKSDIAAFGGSLIDFNDEWLSAANIHLRKVQKNILKTLEFAKSSLFVRSLSMGKTQLKKLLGESATGTIVRASGANFDLRKKRPYYFYKDLEFDIPIGNEGLCYDRVLVRILEIDQSINIILQLIDNIPADNHINEHGKNLYFANQKSSHERKLEDYLTQINRKPIEKSGCLYIEATEGISGFYIEANENSTIRSIRYRNPKILNLFAFLKAVEGIDVEDFDIIYTSFGIESYSFGALK
jgi:NADH:ubiquinone oxidoreductase subunit D